MLTHYVATMSIATPADLVSNPPGPNPVADASGECRDRPANERNRAIDVIRLFAAAGIVFVHAAKAPSLT